MVGEKIISFRHSRHLGDSPFPPAGGEGGGEKICVTFEFVGSFIFVGVRVGSSKTIKTGLNCRQESVSHTLYFKRFLFLFSTASTL